MKTKVMYIEPDEKDFIHLKRILKSEKLEKQFEIKHCQKWLHELIDTPIDADIIIVDTSAVQGELITVLGCEDNLTANLRYFIEHHRSSRICLVNYVKAWAEDWYERIKEDLDKEDCYFDYAQNGASNIIEYLQKVQGKNE